MTQHPAPNKNPRPADRALVCAVAVALICVLSLSACFGLRDQIYQAAGLAVHGRLIAVIGPASLNGRPIGDVPEIGGELPIGGVLALPAGSLVYLEYAPGFVARLTGPTSVAVRYYGFDVTSGEIALLADDGESTDAGVVSADDQNESLRSTLARFCIVSPRAEYRLSGTFLALEIPEAAIIDGADQLLVLDGGVDVTGDDALDARVMAGEGLRVTTQSGEQQRAQIFTLQDYDTESLVAMRDSLARYTAHANARSLAVRTLQLTMEELRAMYGTVSEYRLRDGRVLRGFLLMSPEGDFIRTPEGPVAISMADVVSVVLIE